MRNRLLIITVLLLAISLTSAYAGNELRTGTAGAQELLIPYGSRGTSMAGAVLSTVSGVESMYWNPAGLASLDGTEVLFTHLPYIADIDVNYVGVGRYVEGFGTIGAGAKVVTIGDIEETTGDDPDGTGRVFSPTLMVLNLSYAKILNANVKFGATVKMIHEDIFNVKATGIAFDAGFIYEPRWNGLSVGVTIKNYGSEMSFDGIGFDQAFNDRPFRPVAAKFDLPSSINFGMAYDFMRDGPYNASLAGTFQSNNYSQDVWQGGGEFIYDEKYSLRAGYVYSDRDTYIYGFNFGAGLTIPIGDMNLGLEYTWSETDIFDNNQYFTLKANF